MAKNLILQNIDAKNNLSESEIKWLEQQELSETIAIAQELEQTREFAALKAKYKATEYQDSTPKSHLYKVLKRLELSNQLAEQDINFLKIVIIRGNKSLSIKVLNYSLVRLGLFTTQLKQISMSRSFSALATNGT